MWVLTVIHMDDCRSLKLYDTSEKLFDTCIAFITPHFQAMSMAKLWHSNFNFSPLYTYTYIYIFLFYWLSMNNFQRSGDLFRFCFAALFLSWSESRMVLCAPTFAASTSFLSSSMSLFSFALRFWNHVMTCALVKPRDCAISSLSAGERYFW